MPSIPKNEDGVSIGNVHKLISHISDNTLNQFESRIR